MSGEDVFTFILAYVLFRGSVATVFDIEHLFRGLRNLRRWGTWKGRA